MSLWGACLGVPGISKRFAGWLRTQGRKVNRLRRRRPRTQYINPVGIASPGAWTWKGRVSGEPNRSAPWQEQIDHLWASHLKLSAELDQHRAETETEFAKLRTETETKFAKLRDEYDQDRQEASDVDVRALPLVGFGTVLSGFSAGMADCLSWVADVLLG